MGLKRLVRGAVRRGRSAWWRLTHRDYLLIFNWHQVAPAFDPNRHHQYTWTRLSDFERELGYLVSEFRILPLSDALEGLKRGSLRGACASLTFDDGDVSVSEHVTPLLRRLNLPATFFINTVYLDGRHSYWFPVLEHFRTREPAHFCAEWPAELQEKALQLRLTEDPRFYDEVRKRVERLAPLVPNLEARLVSAEWLATLDGEQFTIGPHGHEHQRFSMMPAEWQRNDLRENVRVLSQFRAFRPIFAVPFGRVSDWTEETLRIAHEQELDVVLAYGGINVRSGDFYRRIPGDGCKLRSLVAAAFAKA